MTPSSRQLRVIWNSYKRTVGGGQQQSSEGLTSRHHSEVHSTPVYGYTNAYETTYTSGQVVVGDRDLLFCIVFHRLQHQRGGFVQISTRGSTTGPGHFTQA